MTSQKPYLIRALYEWCQDNGFTPYLATMVDETTIVPMQYVNNDQIVLNIAFSATKNLFIDNEWITFQATFNGAIQDIAVPIGNVIAIFAKENSQGMQFEAEINPEANVEARKKPGGLKFNKVATAMLELDLSGLKCPQPVLKTKKFLADLAPQSIVKITTTDPDSSIDLQTFCHKTGHTLLSQEQQNQTIISIIQRR